MTTTLTPIAASSVAEGMKKGTMTLVDIREPDEYIVFHCKSGMRTRSNCDALAAHVNGKAFLMEGGLEAWKSAGLPIAADKSAPMEINRQVQITAGSLVLIGVLLSVFVNPAFVWLSAFIGAGLTFAGLSGWCGMGLLLASAPWNTRKA
mgnify:CR=1 FL=1